MREVLNEVISVKFRLVTVLLGTFSLFQPTFSHLTFIAYLISLDGKRRS